MNKHLQAIAANLYEEAQAYLQSGYPLIKWTVEIQEQAAAVSKAKRILRSVEEVNQ